MKLRDKNRGIMINKADLKQYIIKPPLDFLGLYSESAENLLLGTIATESKLGFYLHQVNGVALGICQMEPNTYNDIWHHYLPSKKDLTRKILTYFGASTRPNPERVIYDLRYAAVMCRLRYLRVPKPLPAPDDIEGMAKYWKKYYNTELGKGTIDKFIEAYRTYM